MIKEIISGFMGLLLLGCETPQGEYEPAGYYHYPDLPHRVFYPYYSVEVPINVLGSYWPNYYYVYPYNGGYTYLPVAPPIPSLDFSHPHPSHMGVLEP